MNLKNIRKNISICIFLIGAFISPMASVIGHDAVPIYACSAKEAVKKPMEYFVEPMKLMNYWGDEAVPLSFYTEKEIEIQKLLNDKEEGIITYSPAQFKSDKAKI